jgi:hypothetical protein
MPGLLYPVASVLIATIGAALFKDDTRKHPYFPCEVSRLLATGDWALRTFQVGVVFVGLVYGWQSVWHALAMACCLGLSVFDDVRHWLLHMMWVWGMIASVILQAVGEPWRAAIVTLALGLYGLRVVVRAVALFYLDGVPIRRLLPHAQAVMYTGKTKHPWTLYAFRLG